MVNKDETTEQRILAAAKQVFLKNGMAGARMQDIADKAGINKALLHYYFRSKDQLFERVFKDAALGFLPRIVDLFESDMDLFTMIERFVYTYLDQMHSMPYLPLFVLSEVHHQPADWIRQLWQERRLPVHKFFDKVNQAIADGLIVPIEPVDLLLNMLSMVIFPFLSQPIVQTVIGIDQEGFDRIIERRKKTAAAFIIDSIRK